MTEKVSLEAFVGKKVGMTRIFDENGNHIPVTVIELIPNKISQVKTKEKDGYEAYQLSYLQKREKLVAAPLKGHLKKANIAEALCRSEELKIEGAKVEDLGKLLSYDQFGPKTFIDVTGTTKGKGTQGVIRRYGFRGGPATHGSHFHRRPGSIGCRATPARVFRGKKMPGHMGTIKNTTQNLVVVEKNEEKGYMLIKGSVPGAKNSLVTIKKAVKKY